MRRTQLLRRLHTTEAQIGTTIDAMERHRAAVAHVIATADTDGRDAKREALAIHADFMAAQATVTILKRTVTRIRGEVRDLDGDFSARPSRAVIAVSAAATTGGKPGGVAAAVRVLLGRT